MFKDQEIKCGECGTRFGFTAEEQSFYADKGLDKTPRRCKPCRLARKQQRQGKHGAGSDGRPPVSSRQRGPASRPEPGGPFVRRSRQNSHGDHDNLPWQRGGKERRPDGKWRPRHGKGPWSGEGWQAPQRGASSGSGGRRGEAGRERRGEAPLYKADFGPQPGQNRPSRRPGGPPRRQENRDRGEMRGNQRRQGAPPRADHAQREAQVLHDAVCSECSAATQVPFKPNNLAPVYCRACLPRHRPRKSPPRGPAAGKA